MLAANVGNAQCKAVRAEKIVAETCLRWTAIAKKILISSCFMQFHRSAHEFLSRAACVRYSSRLSIKRLRYSVSQVLDVHCVSGGNVLFFAVL